MQKRRTQKNHNSKRPSTRLALKIPTAKRLANIALYYLSRFASSEESLRRMLDNRIRRAALRDIDFKNDTKLQAQLRLDIEGIIDQHRKTGALNDAAYAEVKARGLRRSGRSKRVIEQKLKIKGIDGALIKKALQPEEATDNGDDAEIKAAQILVRRKRLGPYRTTHSPKKTDADMYRKDLASMARAGFSMAIARKILGKKVEEEEL